MNGVSYSGWLQSLLDVVDINNWFKQIQLNSTDQSKGPNADFDVRARTLDLILNFYVKSSSVLELHATLFVHQHQSSYASFGSM